MNSKDMSKKSEPNMVSNGINCDRYINLTGNGGKIGMIDIIMAKSKAGKPIFLDVEGNRRDKSV